MNELTKANKQAPVKTRNQLRLINLICQREEISQADLASLTGLQASTVSNLMREMKDLGLVNVVGKGVSGEKGGKKSDLLGLNGEYGTFTGIYLWKKKVQSYLIDFAGNVLSSRTDELDILSADRISELVFENIENNMRKSPKHCGVGITVQSAVDENGGIVRSRGFDIEMPDFKNSINKKIGSMPVVVENDANCSAHYCYNNYKGVYENLIVFLVYFLPLSMGAGIINERNILRGTYGGAGEIWRPKNTSMDNYVKRFENNFEKLLKAPDLEEILSEITRYILSACMFVDTQALVLGGDLNLIGQKEKLRFIKDIKNECPGLSVVFEERKDLPLLGAAQLATELYLNKFLMNIA